MGALKSGFNTDQGFRHESPSHKVLYVNRFYSLYHYDHYDLCLINIVILYYM